MNNAYTLIHDKGVPFSAMRLVNEEEEGRRVVKVDMTEDAIRFLCQQVDDGDEEKGLITTNGASNGNGHSNLMRAMDSLPVSPRN